MRDLARQLRKTTGVRGKVVRLKLFAVLMLEGPHFAPPRPPGTILPEIRGRGYSGIRGAAKFAYPFPRVRSYPEGWPSFVVSTVGLNNFPMVGLPWL